VKKLIAFFFILATLMPLHSFANCVFKPSGFRSVTLPPLVPAVIPRDLANGSVLAWSATSFAAGYFASSCSISGGIWGQVSVNSSAPWGGAVAGQTSVYPTLISGVGYRLKYSYGGVSPTPSYAGDIVNFGTGNVISLPGSNPLYATGICWGSAPGTCALPGYLLLELVKTGPILPGSLGGGTPLLGTINVLGPSGGLALQAYMNPAGFSVTVSACTITTPKNINVAFGKVPKSKFMSVGSTPIESERNFSIGLSCQGGVAYNTNIRFDGTADSSGAPGVLQLTAEPGVASGIGIQILDARPAAPAPVTLGKFINNPQAVPMGGGFITMPFLSRYYQTATTVTAGKANGIATFTIEYR
jgi:type 1 fimbria pilin